MSSTPTTPTPAPKKGLVSQFFDFLATFPGVAFLKAHEKLIIVVIVALTALHFWSTGLNAWQAHEQKNLANIEQQLDATKAQVAQSQAAAAAAQQSADATKQAAAQQQAANAAIISSLSAQNTALNQDISKRDSTTQQQQQTDLSSNIPDLGKRFVDLVPNVNPADINVAADGNSVTIGKDTAQKTVAQLELIPALQADKANLNTEITNLNTELASSQKTLDITNQALTAEENLATILQNTVNLQTTELAQDDKACDAKLAIEKTKSKKSFWNGTKFGVAITTIAGIAIKVLK